jgi:hypothetical protein
MANARNKVSRGKVEAVYGTYAGPLVAADSLLTRNAQIKPLIGEEVERPLDLPGYGARPKGFSKKRGGFDFEIEMAGSGLNTLAPKWMGVINRACGMGLPASIVAGGQRMEQVPVSNDGLSLSFDLNVDNLLHVQRGARGTFGWTLEAGQIPFFNYNMTSLINPGAIRSALAAPAPDFSAFIDPVEVNTANTVFSLDGYSPLLRSFTGAMNNTVPFRSLVGQEVVRLTNHEISGTIVIEDPEQVKDYLAIVEARTKVVCFIEHGKTAGNIVRIEMPRVQLTVSENPYSNEDDVLMLTLNWTALINSGNDDIKFIAK